MAYSDWTLSLLKQKFGVNIETADDLFADVAPAAISALLRKSLDYQVPLALNIGTEKGKSELIIAPVLLEVRRQLENRVSLFSGVQFDVDIDAGLRGVCDFLFTLSSLGFEVEAPVVTVVEVKNDNIKLGVAQCVAEMIAARQFNRQDQNEQVPIFGIVTTGSGWRFLRLIHNSVLIDDVEYGIQQVEKIVGITVAMMREASQNQQVREGKTLYNVL